MSFSASGKQRRLARLFRHNDGRVVILPIDDGLISGPTSGLSNLSALLNTIRQDPPDGLLAFVGVLTQHCDALNKVAMIINLTASTKRGSHTQKILCTDLEAAVAAGADIVAVHVNVTSQHENAMLCNLRIVVRHAEILGIPVLAIMYPRREGSNEDDNYQDLQQNDPDKYAKLVCHAARIGMELGADMIKTQYTGSTETFEQVVRVAHPVPVVIAGGPLRPEQDIIDVARGAIAAGGRGVSFGRNVFEHPDPARMLACLHSAVHTKGGF